MRFGSSLTENRNLLADLLHYPSNIGIQMHPFRIGRSGPDALLLWVDKLAADELVRQVLEHVTAYDGAPLPDAVAHSLPLPGQTWEERPEAVVAGLHNGHAALLADGWSRSLLVEMAAPFQRDARQQAGDPHTDQFGTDLRSNVGLLRQRIQDPDLLALPVRLRRQGRGECALVYLRSKARPSLVRLVRLWTYRHMGEETATQGVANPVSAVFGLLPRWDTSRWPDAAATLLDRGHLLLITDRSKTVLAAPVTAAAWLTAPSDFSLRLPLKRWLARLGILLYLIVLLLPGTVVALMNYHTDMVPTAFLAAVVSYRENAPFGLVFEILFVELLVEVGREAAWRLPERMPIGLVLITQVLIAMVLIHSGLVGPIANMAGILGSLASLALIDYGATYLVRIWRFYLLLAAVAFGFFGMATVMVMLLTYLCMAKPWGIPFLGPSGWEYSSPEANAASGPRPKGGSGHGKVPAHLR